MIIICPCGEKKFEVDSNLIPEKGRMLKCGSCDQTWFYNPTTAIKSDIYQEIEPKEKPKLPEENKETVNINGHKDDKINIDLSKNNNKFFYDIIYNPTKTKFLKGRHTRRVKKLYENKATN